MFSGCTAGGESTPQNVTEREEMSQIAETTPEAEIERMDPIAIPELWIKEAFFTIDYDGNEAADVFFDKTKEEVVRVELTDHDGVEMAGDLPWELTSGDEEQTAEPGDLLLSEGKRISICYAEYSGNFTRLGSLNIEDAEELKSVLGDGAVTAEFTVEWTE